MEPAMRALIIGSGGREHALAWKLSRSNQIDKIFVAPGNGGTEKIACNIPISVEDIDGLVEFAKKENIDLVLPGPELPLTLGVTDAMQKAGIPCFGPDKFCARLEGSKSFAKEIMQKSGVPTAAYKIFSNCEEAKAYILSGPECVVLKADGLAAGKGVIVANSHDEALTAIEELQAKKLIGNNGQVLLIEEKLEGEEVSLLCMCDGQTALPFSSAQDHKTVNDHDKGANTGGMGAYCPAPLLPDNELERMTDLVIRPILKTMAELGHPFTGVLYAGLMITREGPKVLEYNVRFGDPECQPLMLRLQSDLAAHLKAACKKSLNNEKMIFDHRAALGVVLCAKGYPDNYAKDQPISGLDKEYEDTVIFHGGTKKEGDNYKSSGGRVLCVTSYGDTLPKAQNQAYKTLAEISMPYAHWRKDIGLKGILRERMLQAAGIL